jgi:hypothetical protein
VFIEMIDLLRCVKPHDDTWLVASFREITNRLVIEGTLGCPVCSAQYEIAAGVPDFTLGEATPSCDEERAAASHRREELATRAGAYLDATQPGATMVLGGLWAHAAEELSQLADVRVLTLNAPAEVREGERVGLVRISERLPLAPDSVDGIALDAWFPLGVVESAWRAVKPGRRLVGAASMDPPSASTVLARDENYWVAEKAPQTISLRRSSHST